MKHTYLSLFAAILLVLTANTPASANMLADPGFDSMDVQEIKWDTTPWWGGGGGGTASGGGAWVTDSNSKSAPHSATLFLYGNNWAYSMVAQTLTSGITPGTQYVASAFFNRQSDITPGEALFKIEWLNAGGGVVKTDEGTTLFNNTHTAGLWHSLSDVFTAPADTVSAKYEIVFKKTGAGDPNDIWVDDASFDVVPEPTSIVLLGLGLVGLISITRRKS
ncbi:MAG: PEP-CTERM sorting domain-containing protein [Candidatus Aureabacteria bacterium]|nr:PEP-CTERM sorting domain-containing protein [Candidatus Auribacterota bacterium]